MNERASQRATLVVTLALLSAWPAAAGSEAACTSYSPGKEHAVLGTVIRIEADPELTPAIVGEAIGYWQSCPDFGTGFPRFVTSGEADHVVRVQLGLLRPGRSQCGYTRGHDIVIYQYIRPRGGRLQSCGALAENLAHELGHVLGLGHPEQNGRCRFHMMTPLFAENRFGRHVEAAECRLISDRWITEEEAPAYFAARSADGQVQLADAGTGQ